MRAAPSQPRQAEELTAEQIAANKKKRQFKKFEYRGIDLEKLLELNKKDLVELLHSRQRRRFNRGVPSKYQRLVKKLRKAKKETAAFEKPATVNTHLRDMVVMPEMIGSVVGVYNGKQFNAVEVKVRPTGVAVVVCTRHASVAKLSVSRELC